jgi:hypothetical protein
MEISSYSVTTYLLILTIGGVLGVLFGIHLKIKSPRRSSARKIFLRGVLSTVLGLGLLALLRFGKLSGWTALSIAAVILVANECVLIILNRKFPIEGDLDNVTLSAKWSEIRRRGKRKFILTAVIIYGLGALWIGILLKIILMASFPLYLLAPLVLVFIGWGYLDSNREWNLKEREYVSMQNSI